MKQGVLIILFVIQDQYNCSSNSGAKNAVTEFQ
jgi:hypothetical protein